MTAKRLPRPAGLAGEDMLAWMQEQTTETAGGCWTWPEDRLFPSGYGQVWWRGRSQRAHRVAYELACGPIPDGLQVNHHCDNPACIRPDHLYVGTQRENIADAVRRGRHGRARPGSRHHNAKLTEDDVREMRRRANGGESHTAISADFPVGRDVVSRIVRGLEWRHVR